MIIGISYAMYTFAGTGTIYGVYDMSGGTYERVMELYKPETLSGISDESGFSENLNYDLLPDSKYYDEYTTEENYMNLGLQHAMVETKGWDGGAASFFNSFSWDNWMNRSSNPTDVFAFNLFDYRSCSGEGNSYDTTRYVLVK